jgi:hypothetical protein
MNAQKVGVWSLAHERFFSSKPLVTIEMPKALKNSPVVSVTPQFFLVI